MNTKDKPLSKGKLSGRVKQVVDKLHPDRLVVRPTVEKPKKVRKARSIRIHYHQPKAKEGTHNGRFLCWRCNHGFPADFGIYGRPSELDDLEWYCIPCAKKLHITDFIVK